MGPGELQCDHWGPSGTPRGVPSSGQGSPTRRCPRCPRRARPGPAGRGATAEPLWRHRDSGQSPACPLRSPPAPGAPRAPPGADVTDRPRCCAATVTEPWNGWKRTRGPVDSAPGTSPGGSEAPPTRPWTVPGPGQPQLPWSSIPAPRRQEFLPRSHLHLLSGSLRPLNSPLSLSRCGQERSSPAAPSEQGTGEAQHRFHRRRSQKEQLEQPGRRGTSPGPGNPRAGLGQLGVSRGRGRTLHGPHGRIPHSQPSRNCRISFSAESLSLQKYIYLFVNTTRGAPGQRCCPGRLRTRRSRGIHGGLGPFLQGLQEDALVLQEIVVLRSSAGTG